MNKFEPYLFYIVVFFGLILVFGILVFIAYHAVNKNNNNID